MNTKRTNPPPTLYCEPSEHALAAAFGEGFAARPFEPPAEPAGSDATLVALFPRPETSDLDGLRLAAAVRRLRTVALAAGTGGTVAFVQFGRGPGPRDPLACSTQAFAASLHLERPGLRVRVIDLPPDVAAERVPAVVRDEVERPGAFVSAAYDGDGRRLVPRARLRQPAADSRRPIAWTNTDVILVTGGAKGITAECALAAARTTGAKLALVGSSPEADPEVARTLERCRADGVGAHYFRCDVTDRAAVGALVRDVEGALGRVTGVIHGAGLNRPRRAEQVSEAGAVAEVGPKLLGAANLFAALAGQPPKLFVALTSVIGVTGMPGNAWYGFANEALDLALGRFGGVHAGTGVLSVAFSVWGETGMGARLGTLDRLGQLGIASIPTDEGVRRFVHLFTHDPGERQVVVAAQLGGLDTWPTQPPRPRPGWRFVEQITHTVPEVELTARTRLTPDRDPYVGDHVFRGSALFPTVFGLEAMAQAVACLTGEEQPAFVRIEDVRLDRPIVVDPTNGTEIELHVEAAEASAPGERAFLTRIRTAQTGFAIDHFSAVLVLGLPVPGPTHPVPRPEPLPLDPAGDLYGPLLFQGPRFQKMRRVLELDGDHAVLEAEATDPTTAAAAAFGRGRTLLLGDPFLRDVLLQTGQLTIPRVTCLPVRIDRIELFAPNAGPGTRVVFAPFKVREGNEYVAEVFVTDPEGRLRERLTGYRLRILEEHPDRPTAEELASSDTRDQRRLAAVLAGAVPPGLALPAVVLAPLAGLHALPRARRRLLELPLVHRAVGAFVERPVPFEVEWHHSGEPRFKVAPEPGLGLSFAHDEHNCLCVVGRGPQGCDITPVTHRDRPDWVALLGEKRMTAVDDLARGGDTLDVAGARVWAAVEAVRKATQAAEINLVPAERREGGVVLTAATRAGHVRVLTVSVQLNRGPKRVIAVVLSGDNPTLPEASVAGIDPARHSVSVADDGPQGQPVQELRFVVSFQESSGISRRVPAPQYLRWMGRMRELVTSANVPSLVPLITSGDWGLVTNWADVRVCGEATANDVVQMRFWTDAPRGPEVEFFCDFWKVGPGRVRERLAFGSQKATWVRLVGHGQVAPAPLPPAFAEFLDRMGPRNSDPLRLPPLPEPLAGLNVGLPLLTAAAGPAHPMRTDAFDTTLEEANLVGNVYFANYFAWQGRVRDRFLHAVSPAYFRGTGGPGEWLVRHSRVDYLREAMPFDRVEVVMGVREVTECGAVFGFEYFRVGAGGERQKLSVGTQAAVWVKRGADGIPVPGPIPDPVRRAMLRAAHPAPFGASVKVPQADGQPIAP